MCKRPPRLGVQRRSQRALPCCLVALVLGMADAVLLCICFVFSLDF